MNISPPAGELRTETTASSADNDLTTGILVIGAGIAGLSFALRLPSNVPVIVVTKGALGESNTWYAQGGLAVALGADDDPELHYIDTMAAGAGLCDADAVRVLVEHAPAAVTWLIEQGTRFDAEGGELALGREAAHSRNRVLHAGGDATGAEIERSLVAKLREQSHLEVLEHTAAVELLTAEGRCLGAVLHTEGEASFRRVLATTTVLANGGAGRLWAVTSNPPGASGDGIAMALQAGATVADLEFTQFHPTVLSIDGVDPFLITEAIRGEGAYLVDQQGARFMPGLHPLAELAPRDVVARAIQHEVTTHDGQPVFLDLRHLDRDLVLRRFPTIAKRLADTGLSITDDLIPVAPAAHYFMGGVVADTEGWTSMPGLMAIGEVSCTGVHGANRLASNSLLEGLVFGLRAADAVAARNDAWAVAPNSSRFPEPPGDPTPTTADQWAIGRRIQEQMSLHVAVVRDAHGLQTALNALSALDRDTAVVPIGLRHMLKLAIEITRSALEREESRGSHFRRDFPELDPALDGMHQLVESARDGVRRRYGSLQTAWVPHLWP